MTVENAGLLGLDHIEARLKGAKPTRPRSSYDENHVPMADNPFDPPVANADGHNKQALRFCMALCILCFAVMAGVIWAPGLGGFLR